MAKVKKLNPGAALGQKARHKAIAQLKENHKEEYNQLFEQAKDSLKAADEPKETPNKGGDSSPPDELIKSVFG